MADFSAKDVQALRKSTGAGMMDSKRALTETDGDMEAAVQLLREKGLAKALTRTDRENKEGIIAVASNETGAALVQLKSETDFSAKSEAFLALAQELAEVVLAGGPEAVSQKQETIEDLKLVLKENIEIGDIAQFATSDGSAVDAYLHGGGKAGVLIEATGVDSELLHEIALHIAFAKPVYLTREEVPAELVDKERAALLEITKSEGKPEQAWDKIVEGRVNAWFGGLVLLEQGVLGEKEKVAARIGDGTISRFIHSTLG